MLANISSYFRTKIEQSSQSSTSGHPRLVLKVGHNQGPAACALIQFVYQGKLPEDATQGLLVHTLQLADMFQVPDCATACLDALLSMPLTSLQWETVHQVLSLPTSQVTSGQFQPLVGKCVDRLQGDFGDLEAVFKCQQLHERFVALPLQAVKLLLEDERTMAASENTALAAVHSWMSQQGFVGGDERQHLAAAIRVPQLEPLFLATVVPKMAWFAEILGTTGLAVAMAAARGMFDPHAAQVLSEQCPGMPKVWMLGPRSVPEQYLNDEDNSPALQYDWLVPAEQVQQLFAGCGADPGGLHIQLPTDDEQGNAVDAYNSVPAEQYSAIGSPHQACYYDAAACVGSSGKKRKAAADARGSGKRKAAARSSSKKNLNIAIDDDDVAGRSRDVSARKLLSTCLSPVFEAMPVRRTAGNLQQSTATGECDSSGADGHTQTMHTETAGDDNLAKELELAAATGFDDELPGSGNPTPMHLTRLRSMGVAYAGHVWRLVLYLQPEATDAAATDDDVRGSSRLAMNTSPGTCATDSGIRTTPKEGRRAGGSDIAHAARVPLTPTPGLSGSRHAGYAGAQVAGSSQNAGKWTVRLAVEARPVIAVQGTTMVAFSGSISAEVAQQQTSGRDSRTGNSSSSGGQWLVRDMPQGSYLKSRGCDYGYRDFFELGAMSQWIGPAWSKYVQQDGSIHLRCQIWNVR